MKYLFILLNLFVCVNTVYAHEPNEAFFTFSLKDSLITVEAELPWSMRNALIDYNPKLEKSATKQDFEETFFEYIKNNLILKDKNGVILELQKIEELKTYGHSHQNNYLFTFIGDNLLEVTNTIMFNLYKKQINYNTLTSNEVMFKTSNNKNSFKTNEEKKSTFSYYWWLFFIPISLVILMLIKKNYRQ